MSLYDRLLPPTSNPPITHIPPGLFCSLLAEFARGAITGPQALNAVAEMGGVLDSAEIAEIQTLLATVTGTPVEKLQRGIEIRDVLALVGVIYMDVPSLQTRLGV